MDAPHAKRLRRADDDGESAEPFTDEEIKQLLAACDSLENFNEASVERARVRARALLLTLLYSGLRVSDVAQLRRSALNVQTGRLFLRRQHKTNKAVYMTLHADAVAALQALPVESREYFFWSGNGKLWSITGSMRRTIERLGDLAGVHAHPHRFRDTFAEGLLRNGTDMRTVQLLLGHKSIKTTEKHYAHFLDSTQRQRCNSRAELRNDCYWWSKKQSRRHSRLIRVPRSTVRFRDWVRSARFYISHFCTSQWRAARRTGHLRTEDTPGSGRACHQRK